MPPQIEKLATHAEYAKLLVSVKADIKEDMSVSPVIQTTESDKRKLIPGSTLKGAYRSAIEKYFIDLCLEELGRVPKEMKPCIPASVNSLSDDEKEIVRDNLYRNGSCVFEEDGSDDPANKEQTKSSICPACYFLGAQGLPGFVSVPCLYENGSKYGVFKVVLFVLMRGEQKNWEFGRARPYEVDPWINEKFTAEQYLQLYVIERLKVIQSLGSEKGSLRVKIEVSRL